MSKVAWASDAIIGSTSDYIGDIFLGERSAAKEAEISQIRSTRGWVLGPEKFPKKTLADTSKPRKLRNFSTAGFFLVSPEVANVLSNVDLGQGAMYETEFFEEDRRTPIDVHHVYLNIGNEKDSFLADLSPNTDRSGAPKSWPEEDRIRVRQGRSGWKDDDVALDASCLEGPDIWVEKCFNTALFISDKLAALLRSQNLEADFKLKRCRVF